MKSMKLTKNQSRQIRALKRMKDEDIAFTDIPEKTDWSGSLVGKFYRTNNKPGEVGRDGERVKIFADFIWNIYLT
jgi:hypothetical protein